MKLEIIVNGFQPLMKLFDSIDDFERQWKLVDAFDEIKKAARMYEEKREELAKKYADDKGEIRNEDFKKYQEELKKLRESDIELKHVLSFTKEDVKKAKLVVSEMSNVKGHFVGISPIPPKRIKKD